MALILGLKQRQDLMIGSEGAVRLVVKTIKQDGTTVVVKEDGCPDRHFKLSEEYSTEVYPEVRIALGHTGDMDIARLVIEAPRSIKLLKGSTFRNDIILESEGVILNETEKTLPH